MNFIILILVIWGVFAVNEIYETDEKIKDVNCLKNEQPNAVFVRGYRASGMVDPNLQYNINELTNAGVPASAYMHPCFHCGNPAKQAQDLMAACPIGNRRFFVYIVPGQWGKDHAANIEFLKTIAAEFEKNGDVAGIATNEQYFNEIMGADNSDFAQYMLFYIHDDEEPNCNEFKPFGGWNHATAKKYSLEDDKCDNTIDYFCWCAGLSGSIASANFSA